MHEIKKVSIEGIPLIQTLSREIWNKVYPSIIGQDQIDYMLNMMYSESSLRTQMVEMKHHFIILYFSGIPSGFASHSIKSVNEPNVIRLNKLYLQPELHGKGLGKAMLEAIIEDARLIGGHQLELNVNKANPAIEFYTKQGFLISSETVLDIGNGYVMDDYIMTRSI